MSRTPRTGTCAFIIVNDASDCSDHSRVNVGQELHVGGVLSVIVHAFSALLEAHGGLA